MRSTGFNSLDEMYFFDSAFAKALVLQPWLSPFANASLKKNINAPNMSDKIRLKIPRPLYS
jgi:hypothetical protein